MSDEEENDESSLHIKRFRIERGEFEPVTDDDTEVTMEVEAKPPQTSPNLARDHLYMAILFADKAKTIEDEYDDPELKRTEHRFYATGSVIAAFSFVEACINELIYTGLRANDVEARLDLPHAAALDIIQDYTFVNFEHMGTLDKYKLMLAIADEDQFNTHGEMYENMSLVNTLRNALIHHTPQFDVPSADNTEQYMGDKLDGKFETSPFVSESALFFPYQCMSFGCAKWAIESCLSFTETFYSRVDVSKPYSIPETSFPIDIDRQES